MVGQDVAIMESPKERTVFIGWEDGRQTYVQYSASFLNETFRGQMDFENLTNHEIYVYVPFVFCEIQKVNLIVKILRIQVYPKIII